MQDNHGFLWTGTSAGFSSFDGKSFNNFLKAGNQITGRIYDIKEDIARKILWVACSAGLCYLKNERLSIMRTNERDVTAYDIYSDKNNNLWVATAKGPAFLTSKIINDLISDSIITLDSHLLPDWKNYEKVSDQV